MSTAAPARRPPGPRPTIPEVAPEERSLLEWLQRLRVITPFQAHWLVDYFHAVNEDTKKPRTERNTRMRLQRLAKEGFIKAALTHPEKGGYSGIYYRLGGKGLRVLGIPEEKNLLRVPAPPVLRYLLLRNELYARAREDGWMVCSPLFTPEEKQRDVLAAMKFYSTVFLNKRAREGNKRAEDELRHVERIFPEKLTFECLVKLDPVYKRVIEVVLLVVDDIRRRIVRPKKVSSKLKPTKLRCEKCGAPMVRVPRESGPYLACTGLRCRNQIDLEKPTPPQFEELPLLLPGAKLLLRDTQSVYDVQAGKLSKVSPRLRQWRRALEGRFTKDFLATDVLFPDVWTQRINVPTLAMPGSNPIEDGDS